MALADAMALHRASRLPEAAAIYEALLAADPRNFDVAYFLSVLRASQGDLEAALGLALRAVQIRPQAWEAQAQAGSLLAALSRPDEALAHLQQAATLKPDRAEVYNNIGAALRSLGRLAEARRQFAKAVALNPHYLDAICNLSKAATAAGDHAEAVAQLQAAVAGGSETAELCDALGRAIWKGGRPHEGIGYVERAIALDARHTDAWADLGLILTEIGDIPKAEEAFLRALALDPDRGDVYRFLVETNPSAIRPEHVAALERLAQSGMPAAKLIDVHFALGRILASSDKQRSFEHFVVANTERRKTCEYDEAETLGAFERVASLFSAGFLEARADQGDPSTLPVFIFGMPRSGTTLIEQILASHPAVYGAGELEDFGDVAERILAGGAPVTPEAMLAADGARLRSIGEQYVAKLRERAGTPVQRVTDKMPGNFKYAGLIHLVLPGARMIHARRDPVETCLSCFVHNFGAEGLAWTFDLRELGRYYGAYRRLMAHWQAVLPAGAMLEVQYEDVVADLEGQARRIVDYCGLPWDERCLEFYKTDRPVQTASAVQVRQPIYRTSLHASREYGAVLAPLIDALGNAV